METRRPPLYMARADAPLRQEAVDGGTGAATADAFYVRLHLLSEDVRFVVMTEIAALPTVGALSQKVLVMLRAGILA